jgi:hypothetical protein
MILPEHSRVLQLCSVLEHSGVDSSPEEVGYTIILLDAALDGLAIALGYASAPLRTMDIRMNKPVDQDEAGGAKALLLNIVHRAAADWVLYRTSARMENRQIAEDAFRWIFREGPGTADWRERNEGEKGLTSFLGICQALDIDPEVLRRRIKEMTPQQAVGRGRPAEYRRARVEVVRTVIAVKTGPLLLGPKIRG